MPAPLRFRKPIAIAALAAGLALFPAAAADPAAPSGREERLVRSLDAPLLFVKRHSYTGIHIYDTYYKWPPGGGGIHVLENPAAPRSQWRVRPVIDPATPNTLGTGVYSHPELSWDATRILFCFKDRPDGNTCIHEIGIDGRNLRRVTDPSRIASRTECPSSRSWLANSTIRMPFLAISPTRRISPTWL